MSEAGESVTDSGNLVLGPAIYNPQSCQWEITFLYNDRQDYTQENVIAGGNFGNDNLSLTETSTLNSTFSERPIQCTNSNLTMMDSSGTNIDAGALSFTSNNSSIEPPTVCFRKKSNIGVANGTNQNEMYAVQLRGIDSTQKLVATCRCQNGVEKVPSFKIFYLKPDDPCMEYKIPNLTKGSLRVFDKDKSTPIRVICMNGDENYVEEISCQSDFSPKSNAMNALNKRRKEKPVKEGIHVARIRKMVLVDAILNAVIFQPEEPNLGWISIQTFEKGNGIRDEVHLEGTGFDESGKEFPVSYIISDVFNDANQKYEYRLKCLIPGCMDRQNDKTKKARSKEIGFKTYDHAIATHCLARRRYRCEICGIETRSPYSFSYHKRRAHPVQQNEPNKTGNLQLNDSGSGLIESLQQDSSKSHEPTNRSAPRVENVINFFQNSDRVLEGNYFNTNLVE